MSINGTASMVTRGSYVIVGNSHKNKELRGEKLEIRSNGMVPCNKKGRCAGPHCIGKALFVVDKTREQPTDDTHNKGWRTGATKICLTHLCNTEGKPLIDVSLKSQVTAVAQKSSSGVSADLITWEVINAAETRGSIEELAELCRALKIDTEQTRRQLVAVQSKVIDLLAND